LAVSAIRNTPLLVQLFVVFFGFSSLGVRLSAPTAAIVALTVNLGAYATETIRAGFEAVPRAQVVRLLPDICTPRLNH